MVEPSRHDDDDADDRGEEVRSILSPGVANNVSCANSSCEQGRVCVFLLI